MPEINLEARYARQVFLKYAPPLQAVQLPNAQSIANQALSHQSGSSAEGLGRFIAKTARPDTRVAQVVSVSFERGGALALRPAQAAAQVAARRTATQVLMSRVTVASASELGALALQPAVRASAAVGGAIARTPVIGSAVRFGSRFVPKGGPFLAITALAVVPDVMELFAPGVHNWLKGGWSGRGYGKLSPNAGKYLLDGDVNSIYRIEVWGKSIGDFEVIYNIYSQPGLTDAYLTQEGGNWLINFASVNTNGEIQTINTFRYTSYWSKTYVKVYKNDVEVKKGTLTERPPIVNEPGKKSTNTIIEKPSAIVARDAAFLASLATIAAGKLKLPPKLKNPPTQIPARKVGLLPSASPTTPPPSSQPCKGNSCGQAGLDQATKNGQDLQTILDLINALGIGDIRKTVNRIDTKIGPQITDAVGNKRGLTEIAMDTVKSVGKIKDYLPIDRALNLLTLATTVHNATMLSNNLVVTLESTISNLLAAINIKDVDNNPLNIQEIVNKTVEDILKNAVGAANYAVLKTEWKKANRIYQAAGNLLNNLQSLRYSITGALETIGGMNAKVGNALKKYGVLGDNAYPWFNPSPNYDNKFMRGLEVAETTVSSIDSVASEILSAQDSVKQIGEQKTELEKAIKSGTEKPGVDNDQQKAKAAAAKTASASPDINPVDFVKPGGI